MEEIITLYNGRDVQIIHTEKQLLMVLKCYEDNYLIDLTKNEHQFFVRYHDANTPLFAHYFSEKGEVEVGTDLIDFLESYKEFICDIRLYDEDEEQNPLRPQDCLLTVNVKKDMETTNSRE